MKKTTILGCVFALCACAGTTDAGNGLTRLTTEPTNCEYLYTLDSNASTYNINDAYDYLEKSILEQKGLGDSYYVSKEDILENVGAVFGPRKTYKFKAKVYNCKK